MSTLGKGTRVRILKDCAYGASVDKDELGTIQAWDQDEGAYSVRVDGHTEGSHAVDGIDCWYLRDEDFEFVSKPTVRGRRIKPADTKLIRRAVKAGLSVRQVARALGLSKSSVHRAVSK